ncbi:MAG TPA: DUF4097 family beta strand repeat-containing protein [Gemmatimonadaceae bacterium]|nr:DUF4097 family beta strand repeat-containing protein [Gemmatimonadaceae bacterium]
MRPRPILAMMAVLVATAPLMAQGRPYRGDDFDSDQQSKLDTTLTLNPSGTVDLSLVSGEIKVTSWDRNQVRIVATTEQGVLNIDGSPSRVALTVRGEGRHNNVGDATFQVTVPSSARLLMRTVSGEITSRGGAEVEAHTVSGDLSVSDVKGRATLETVSGELTGTGIGGNTRANSVSGDVTLHGVTGDVDAETVSGDIELTDARSSSVRMSSTSGDAHYQGTVDPKGRYDFHSYSGDVRLALPASTSAQLSVETFSGDLDSDFPMTLLPGAQRSSGHPKRMEFRIGNGGAIISATTFSGDVTIERGSGRSED